MTDRPLLFDVNALEAARSRAANIGFAEFLHQEAYTEVNARLAEVNRSFDARALVAAFGDEWQGLKPDCVVAPDDTLALAPQSFDLVVHALALHSANDPVGQLIQMRRALRPDGMAVAVLFGGRSLSEFRTALTQAEVDLSGGLRPRFAPMAEIRDLGGLLQRAGFALPVADSIMMTATYPDLSTLMHDLRAMGETNIMQDRPRNFTRKALFARAQEIYRARFSDPEGRLRCSIEMIFLTGWAPDQSQQKPMQPGTAKMRLADALDPKKMPD